MKGSRPSSVAAVAGTLALAALLGASPGLAQRDAAGEPVVIPGVEISGWGEVAEIPGRFGRPTRATAKVPAVLLLHGSGGVDGRGAFYAQALQDAGIATLEITMFSRGERPAGSQFNMPHVAAALKWLAAQPSVDGTRLGALGVSWGGGLSVTMSSETVQERLGKDVPKPAALVALYPVCTIMARNLANPQRALYNIQTTMSATPMLIFVGTLDDYEEGPRPCDAFIATWPAAAREATIVRYVDGATHGFDSQVGPQKFYDLFVHAGQGGWVNVIPNPKVAEEARQEAVSFFVKYLKP